VAYLFVLIELTHESHLSIHCTSIPKPGGESGTCGTTDLLLNTHPMLSEQMTRKFSGWLPAVAVAVLVVGMSEVATAATPFPAWDGEPNTTRQGYAFTSRSLTPAADILRNPYQTPVATVTLGALNDGWQDPQVPWANSGVLSDGAWDIGKAGTITVTCKVAATPPATVYRIDFLVYAVAYKGLTAMPSFECPGLPASALTLTQATVATDPKFPGATWEGLKWIGYFDNVTTNTVSFVIKSPSNNMSVIDTNEVFTKVTGTGVINYDAWALEQGFVAGTAGRLDNPDNDGRINMLEYAFATNPRASDPGPMILSGTAITRRGAPFVKWSPVPYAVFARRDDYLTSGVTYLAQFSSDMKSWTTSTAAMTVLADDGVIQAMSVPFPAGPKQFFRVWVSVP
jgi:hypothetical protein